MCRGTYVLRREGSALSYGVHVGLHGKPSAEVTVGLRFLSPLEFGFVTPRGPA